MNDDKSDGVLLWLFCQSDNVSVFFGLLFKISTFLAIDSLCVFACLSVCAIKSKSYQKIIQLKKKI